jgi:hypothetical protein
MFEVVQSVHLRSGWCSRGSRRYVDVLAKVVQLLSRYKQVRCSRDPRRVKEHPLCKTPRLIYEMTNRTPQFQRSHFPSMSLRIASH